MTVRLTHERCETPFLAIMGQLVQALDLESSHPPPSCSPHIQRPPRTGRRAARRSRDPAGLLGLLTSLAGTVAAFASDGEGDQWQQVFVTTLHAMERTQMGMPQAGDG